MSRRLAAHCLLAVVSSTTAVLAEVEHCTEIVSLPWTITQQGTHCLKKDLSYSLASGSAISVATNNVTVDLNGYKLGGIGGGANTQANGIHAIARQNVTIRNGTIRGFLRSILLDGTEATSSGHLVESIRSDSARHVGIFVRGSSSIVRDNVVFGTGNGIGSTAYGIDIGYGLGVSVMDNLITGVTETGAAYGIFSFSAPGIIVQGNQIREISGSPARGIYINSARSMIRGNTVINSSLAGTWGIEAPAVGDACIDNAVSWYAQAVKDCDTDTGNISY